MCTGKSPVLPITSKEVSENQLINLKMQYASLPVASYVLAPVLNTLFSLGHNPERTESIYTISHDFFKMPVNIIFFLRRCLLNYLFLSGCMTKESSKFFLSSMCATSPANNEL
jgi:hypothetical protein